MQSQCLLWLTFPNAEDFDVRRFGSCPSAWFTWPSFKKTTTKKPKQKRNPTARPATRALSFTQLSANPQVAGERAPAATLSVPRAKRAPLDAIREWPLLTRANDQMINVYFLLYILFDYRSVCIGHYLKGNINRVGITSEFLLKYKTISQDGKSVLLLFAWMEEIPKAVSN